MIKCCSSVVWRWHRYLLYILYHYSKSGIFTGSFYLKLVPNALYSIHTQSSKNLKCSRGSHWNCGILQILDIMINQNTENLIKKLKLKLSSLCFSVKAMKHRIYTAFLPLLDYADSLYLCTFDKWLKKLDRLYQGALFYQSLCTSLLFVCCGFSPLSVYSDVLSSV